jgi:NAD+--asparagine ADP-ribosyltransferase
MSLKISFVICCLSLIIFYGSSAQRSINLQDHLLIKESDKYLYGVEKETFEGSPYFDDNYIMTSVYGDKNEKYIATPMRYNIFSDVMEFQENGDQYILEPDPRIKKLEMGDKIFVVRKFKYLTKTQNGFLEVLEDGKLSLMAKKLVNYRKKIEIKNVPAKYAKLPDIYFTKLDKGDMVKVSSLKSLITSLPDKQQELDSFIKAEKISPRDRDDLIKLVKYYNSISQ